MVYHETIFFYQGNYELSIPIGETIATDQFAQPLLDLLVGHLSAITGKGIYRYGPSATFRRCCRRQLLFVSIVLTPGLSGHELVVGGWGQADKAEDPACAVTLANPLICYGDFVGCRGFTLSLSSLRMANSSSFSATKPFESLVLDADFFKPLLKFADPFVQGLGEGFNGTVLPMHLYPVMDGAFGNVVASNNQSDIAYLVALLKDLLLEFVAVTFHG